MFLAAELLVAVTGKFLLGLAHESVQPCLDIWQSLTDMTHQGGIQALRQELGAASRGHIPVSGVASEELSFGPQSIREGLSARDILLGAVYYSDESQLQRIDPSSENVHCVRAMVHQVKFRQDTDRSLARGIDMARKLQGFRIDNVHVRRRDGKDDTVWLRDVFRNQVARLLLDIRGLVANWHLG